jgi:hypothetical protein
MRKEALLVVLYFAGAGFWIAAAPPRCGAG